MFRPHGYLDDPNFSSDDFRETVAMATKEFMYHKNGGVPFITVSSLPEPEPKDVHFYHYYGQNGTPRNGPPPPAQSQDTSHPHSYVIVGNIEYGRLTSIDPARSTPGVSGVPSRVLAELQSVYAQVPHAVVIVMNHGGKITIQAQLVSQNGQDPQMNQNPPYSNNLGAPYQSPYQPQQPNYYQQPPPPLQQPQIINVGPGVSTIRAQAPGQPIIVYSPRPVRRKASPEPETIMVDINDFTDSEEDSPRVGRRGPERRRRRIRAVNDGRSQLQRKHEELYQVSFDSVSFGGGLEVQTRHTFLINFRFFNFVFTSTKYRTRFVQQ